MAERGRKSGAALATVANPTGYSPLMPPPTLKPAAAVIWREITGSVGRDHFRRCDAPLLEEYCNASYLAAFYASKIGKSPDSFKAWESCVKLMGQLCTKLRLAPSTRLDRKTVGSAREAPAGDPPWHHTEVADADSD